MNSARNHWILSEFYSQIWVDFSTLKKTFLRDFDFIQAYFDLISLVSQLLSQFYNLFEILIDLREWSRAWRPFHYLISQLKSFNWHWLNWLLVLLYLIHSAYFILIYLIDFVDFHWYFEAGRLTVSCQSGGVCCIYTVKLAVCTVWLTLAQPPFKTPKNLRFSNNTTTYEIPAL